MKETVPPFGEKNNLTVLRFAQLDPAGNHFRSVKNEWRRNIVHITGTDPHEFKLSRLKRSDDLATVDE
jgi:hypothetical protein